jgi:hypothetical protein
MRRSWCAAAMVACAVMLPALVAPTEDIGDWFNPSEYPTSPYRTSEGTLGMASDGRFVVAWLGFGYYVGGRQIWARRYDPAGQPQGPSFPVEASVTASNPRPDLSVAADGRFVIVWSRSAPEGWQVRGQRFDADGGRLGQEFVANSVTGNTQTDPALAVDAAGNMVVAWTRAFGSSLPPADGARVFARRFDADGVPAGGEFRVNSYMAGHQMMPSVAFQDGGGFVIAWTGTQQDGSAEGVFAQRYSASGAPLGGEFPVNRYTTGIQAFPCAGATGNGGFVIGWISSNARDDTGPGVFARRFDGEGRPLGREFRVGNALRFSQRACSVARDREGGFAMAWDVASDGWLGVSVRRYDVAGNAVEPIELPGPLFVGTAISLAGDASGRLALVSSQREGGDGYQVFGRLLDMPSNVR